MRFRSRGRRRVRLQGAGGAASRSCSNKYNEILAHDILVNRR